MVTLLNEINEIAVLLKETAQEYGFDSIDELLKEMSPQQDTERGSVARAGRDEWAKQGAKDTTSADIERDRRAIQLSKGMPVDTPIQTKQLIKWPTKQGVKLLVISGKGEQKGEIATYDVAAKREGMPIRADVLKKNFKPEDDSGKIVWVKK
jgi:hypothetical protein